MNLENFLKKLITNALFVIFVCKSSKQRLGVVVIQRVNRRKRHRVSSTETSSSTLP